MAFFAARKNGPSYRKQIQQTLSLNFEWINSEMENTPPQKAW